MRDLIDFLNARLDDEEAVALKAAVASPEMTWPKHALAHVKADRMLVADIAWYADPDHPESEGAETDGLAWRALTYKALPFASHADYRAEWKPEDAL